MAACSSGWPPVKMSRPGPLFLTAPGKKSQLCLYRVSIGKGNTSLVLSFLLSFCFSKRHPLTLHLKLRSLKTAQSKPREVSAHNFLVKACKAPAAAAVFPEMPVEEPCLPWALREQVVLGVAPWALSTAQRQGE